MKRSVSVLNACPFGALIEEEEKRGNKYLQLELVLASLLDLAPEVTVSVCVVGGVLSPIHTNVTLQDIEHRNVFS